MARWFRTVDVGQSALLHGARNLDADLADMINEVHEQKRAVLARMAERDRNRAERQFRRSGLETEIQTLETGRLEAWAKTLEDVVWELEGARTTLKKAGVTPWKSVNAPAAREQGTSLPDTATSAARS